MVDRSRGKLDRQRHRTALRELVAVQPKRKSSGGAGFEVPACLPYVEGAPFQNQRDERSAGELMTSADEQHAGAV